jgi:DNA-binding NarL/FixJ family response regulator
LAAHGQNAAVTIRVVLAEDHALFREGIHQLVDREDDLEVIGTASDEAELINLVDELKPDVVVTDIRMPPTGTDEGVRAASRFSESHPEMGVVVLSQYSSPAYALALLDKGSAGRAYLLKDSVADVGQLVNAIRSVAGGGSVIDPTVVDSLVSARAPKAGDLDRLTPREHEVLAEMAMGKSNGAIAQALVLSERAVEKHINSIFSKLHLSEEPDVNRRVKAVLVHLAATGG